MGRDHVVVPAVLVRSKVLFNNLGRTYLPADAITPEWADASNGAPAVADHPHSTARTPQIMNQLGVGVLYNTRAEGDALKADVYIDPERASEVPDLAVILARLNAGKPVEVSTGFPVSVENRGGVHNGQAYDVVIRPSAGLDHLAVFAEKIGACSVADGCGLARNKDAGCGCTEGVEMKEHELPDPPESIEDAVANTGWRAWVERAAELIGLGPVANSGEAEPADEPKPEAAADEPTPEEGSAMNREQMIAKLAETGTDADALNKLSDCQLKALLGASANNAAPEDGDTVAWQKAKEYREKYEALEAATRNARAAEDKERGDLLDDLLFNQRHIPWSDQELRAMDIVQLRKVHKTAFPQRADFSLRGGPAQNGGGSFDFVQGVMSGPAGSSALDRKEVN